MTTIVLDACALIAHLRGEQGGERLAALFEDVDNTVLIHAINLGEVYYDGLKREDSIVEDLWNDVSALGITVKRDMDDDFVTSPARWKARHRIAYADAFALALAQRESGSLVTTDHKELDPIAAEGQVRFVWLR